MSRNKVPSPKYQVQEALKSQIRFGQSKYQAKLDREPGQRAPEGVFSYRTHDTYVDRGESFLRWAREFHGIKGLADAEKHAHEYLQQRVDQGKSAWTLQQERAALRKIYQNQDLAQNVRLPDRRKMDITRSRGPKPSDVNFSEKKNQGLVDFSKATGLRRMELEAVRVDQVKVALDGTVSLVNIHGKGGRVRDVPVLLGHEKAVIEVTADALARGDIRVWANVPGHMDVHSYRREYAQAMYVQIAGSEYVPYHPDHNALMVVSEALGHSREDVVVRNYL